MNTQLIKLTQDTLFKTQQQIEELDLQLKSIYEKEKTDQQNWSKYYDEKYKIRKELKLLKELERHQQNQTNCLENEGELTTIVDKKGKKHENIPDFRQTDTEQIQFEIDEILTAKLPPYIPVIDEEKFRSKGYVFDAIRIDKDSYILATSEHSEEKQTYYVIVTLDQLVLTQEYYYTKAKAAAIKYAQESDIRQEKYWDSLPEERRQRFLNQQDLYHSLPVKIKKTITQADYEALTWQEKEKIYKFFKRSRPKKLKSQLSSTTMWGSYHRMYERFVNPEAVMPKPRYANKEVWEYWAVFRDMMEYKMKDIAIQRAELSEIRQKAIETSFGEINTSLILKKQYGVLVKRQNGDKINPMEIEQIKDALVSVQKVLGSIKQIAEKTNLKISHTGTRYVFASKAAGMYVPSMGTIAVSDKFGDHQFKMTMAHEIAHFIDNYIGRLNEKRYLTDDYESTAGKVAFTFRKYLNGSKATLSDYTKSTKECFARALEMYYGIETIGENAGVLYSDEPLNEYKTFFIADDFVNKENYYTHIKPLIEQFFKEQKDVLVYGEDIDESNEPVGIGNEVSGETFAEVESSLYKLIEVATTKEDKQQINEAIKVMELMQQLEKPKLAKGGAIRRYNLPINENYKLIGSFYTGGLDNATICDNCDRPIANVATIKNSKEEVFNVGLDCAETLTHLDGLYSAKMDFEELKSIQAKIRKQEKDGKNLEYEIYNNGDLLIKSDGFTIIDKDIDFAKKYMPNYLQKVKNPEKIGFEYKEKEINIPFDRFSPRENKDFVKQWKVDGYDVRVSVKPYHNSRTKEISGYDFYLDVEKQGKNIYSKRVTMYNNLASDINYAIRNHLFDKYNNNTQVATTPSISDLKKRLEIVKKMAAKNPELNSRVKIIEKMLEKPKLAKGGEIYNENLSYLLNPKNTIDFIGEEKGKYIEDGISLYKNKYGSYRYVYSENGTPIAALQVMSMDGKNGVVANAYTVPSKRKKGFGRKLFNHAKKKFKEIKHSEHLSGSGKLFADNVLEKGGQVPNNFIHPKYNDEEYRKAMDIFDVPVDFLWQYREFDRCGKDNIYGDEYIEQFTNYIKENGITKPIILTVDTGKGLITDGNHRLCIAKKLGFKTVPVEVVYGKFGDINKHRSKPINFRKERWYFGFWD